MNKKDQRIIVELVANSRISINKLSKKVGVSREVALYRVSKLKKNIIKGFNTLIDYKILGYNKYTFFIKLKGISLEKEKEFTDYLTKHNFVTYLGSVIGKWNVVFDILVKNDKHLEEIIRDITKEASQYLESYIIIGSGIREEYFPTKFVGVKKSVHVKELLGNKKYKIDGVDKTILKLISNNARIEYTELSKKLKLTPNAIKYRIKSLEKNRIILGYTISLDFKKLEYEFYNIQIKLSNIDNQRIISFLRNHYMVVYYYKYLGHDNWDIDIGIIAKDSMDLRDFILELRENFGDIIDIYDLYPIVEITKDELPLGIFN